MKSFIIALFLVVSNFSVVFSQIKAITQNGETVILLENSTWVYEDDYSKTLSEQYDEVAKYAKDKLGKDINSYITSSRDEARAYVEKLFELLKIN